MLLLLWLAWAARAAALPLHLVAVLPPGGGGGPSALRRAAAEADGPLEELDVALLATPLVAPDLTELCGALERLRPPPAALLSFVRPPMSYYASLVGAHAKIPVIGVTRSYRDERAMSVNPYYISLDPSPGDLATATGLFLSHNGWSRVAVLTDESAAAFARALLLRRGRGDDLHIALTYSMPEPRLFEALAGLLHTDVRVIVVACGQLLAEKIFKQARRANLLSGRWIWILIESAFSPNRGVRPPAGVLGLRLREQGVDRASVRAAVLFAADAVARRPNLATWLEDPHALNYSDPLSCWFGPADTREAFARFIYDTLASRNWSTALSPVFDIYNLEPESDLSKATRWRRIGNVTGGRVHLDTVVWMGGSRVGPPSHGQPRFRLVTAFAPPFVMPATRIENGSCLLGVPCLKVSTNSKPELDRLFADYHGKRRLEGGEYNISCCSGISVDLAKALAQDLKFAFDLYLVADGYFGTRRRNKWNGMTLDVQSGAAHMAFSAFSLTSQRSEVIDYSVPFYHSGVSSLTFEQEREVPLTAFLVPFSPELWIAIFICLNITATVAALYEWLSPFGLNPWGRQRTRNFSWSSALWVMWSLFFSHLVAFKAPKSWPNKVLINLWGCFSVIFVSTYTANIAAHFAGLFFHLKVDNFHDFKLLDERTGTARGSSAESYIHAQNERLWQNIQKYGFNDLEEGMDKLRHGKLDVLIGDTVVLDYYRGNDPSCSLHMTGKSMFDDSYAVGMQKGFMLKNSISTLILRYNEYGLMEQLQKKWFGRVACFTHSVARLNKPQPLSVRSVAGVFLMLFAGHGVSVAILFMEHGVFKYALPKLRKKPPDSFWKSPNVMFFSQKLYRFINTVELVSPHHSAKEIVSNLREGQIFSLFQKSVKRKAKEEARRRKSKSQFFEMIQEIRKVVRLQKEQRSCHPEVPVAIQPRPFPHDPSSPALSPDTQRLLLTSPSQAHSSWTDLWPRGGGSPQSPAANPWPADSAHLSVSVEDLRLEEPPPLRRHGSLDDTRRTSARSDCPSPGRTTEMDELVLFSMSKEDIIASWQSSERKLLNMLRDVNKEKRALEKKLAFIHKTLFQPP